MPTDLTIPSHSGSPLSVTLMEGQPLFVVGRNGAGKSGLMQHFSATIGITARHITGHRSNTFSSATAEINITSRRVFETHNNNTKTKPENRWLDVYGGKSIPAALYDFFAAENARARKYAAAGLAGDEAGMRAAEAVRSPLAAFNQLADLCSIPVHLEISDQGELEAVKGGLYYAANKMSDGERNAFLLAAVVLTAEGGTTILIDEPERHLHRAITKPLITQLVAMRPDCFFVIATHDLEAPSGARDAQTLIVRACTFVADRASAWDANLLPSGVDVDVDVRMAILGARRQVIFVEGTATSLDLPLYQLLFPTAAVVPQNSCRDVESAVRGLRGTAALAWVEAFGIIDNDGRPAADLTILAAGGVHALGVNTVESVYYHPRIVRRVAERRVRWLTGDVEAMLAEARLKTIAAVQPRATYLATRRAHHKVRSMIFAQLPDDVSVGRGDPIAINIDTSAIQQDFKTEIDGLVAAGDWGSIIERFGIKNTAAPNGIAKALSLTERDYQDAVRRMIADDPAALADARAFFGGLPAALGL